MNKFVPVLGVAALTFAGCLKDPNYRRLGDESSRAEATPVEVSERTQTTVEAVQTTETAETSPSQEQGTAETSNGQDTPKTLQPETTVYIVQKGDFLGKIAKRYHLKVVDIKELNGLKSDKIRLGQKLLLPGKIDIGEQTMPQVERTVKDAGAKSGRKPFEPYTGETVEYVVKSGDTLGKLAYGNGINIRQLKALNNLKKDDLKVGQKLKIPANGKSSAKDAPAPEPKDTEPPTAQPPAADSPEAQPAPAEDAAPAEGTYVVHENEDLLSISVAMGVSPSVIREMNNLPEDAVLTPGQVLKVPSDSQE